MYVIPAIDLKTVCVCVLGKVTLKQCIKLQKIPFKQQNLRSGWCRNPSCCRFGRSLDGQGKNRDIVSLIARETKLKIELGGGLRDMESLQIADSIGVARMVIGSAATTNPEFVAQAVSKYGDRIIIGIDAKDGIVRTSGWTESSGMDYLDFAVRMSQAGVKYIIFTDIDRDGMLSGPSVKILDTLKRAVDCDIIASGGVSTIDDLIILKELGMYGAIVGKAIYTGNVHLAEAIERCQ